MRAWHLECVPAPRMWEALGVVGAQSTVPGGWAGGGHGSFTEHSQWQVILPSSLHKGWDLSVSQADRVLPVVTHNPSALSVCGLLPFPCREGSCPVFLSDL